LLKKVGVSGAITGIYNTGLAPLIPITTGAKGEMEWATMVTGAQDQVGTKA